MKLNTLRFLLLITFTVISVATQAQTFKFNSNPKGVQLPVQTVFQVEQDTLGRIWFSTTRGIFFSDGFQTYELPDSLKSLFDYQINIHKDEDGMIWLYNDRGYGKFLKGGYGSWKEVSFPEKLRDNDVFYIFFSTRGKGKEKEYVLDTNYELIFWREGEQAHVFYKKNKDWGKLGHLGGSRDYPIFFLSNSTLRFINGKFEEYNWENSILPSPPVMVKKSPETGEFYFLGSNYLAKGSSELNASEIIDSNLKKDFTFLRDYFDLQFSKGSVFYFFNSNLRKLSYGSQRFLDINLEPLFRVFYIHDFLIDREGVLWIVTSRGLVNLNSLAFQTYNAQVSGLLSDEVTAISTIPGEDSYLIGFNNGIQKVSRSGIHNIYVDSNSGVIPNSRIVNFSIQDENTIWFSANIRGVGKYNVKTGNLQIFPHPEKEGVSSVYAFGDSLMITTPKSVYLASTKGNFQNLYSNSLKSQLEEIMNGFYHLRKAGKLSDGRKIIIRASRLVNERRIIQENGLLIAEGYDYLETENGILLGTETGLKIIKNDTILPFEVNGNTVNRAVFSILKDSKGVIWLGTDDGIFKIDQLQIKHLNSQNGLADNETNRGALIEGNRGLILIGTLDGFSIFKPDEQFFAQGEPKLHLNSIFLGGNQIEEGAELKVPYEKNTLEINYSAIGFNEEDELWVHYRVIGLNENWEVLKNPKSSRIFLPNLPAGEYQVEIKASYEGTNFSDAITTPVFTVLRPFYLRAWFLIMLALFLVGVGFFINSFFDQLRKLGVLESVLSKKDKEKVHAEEQFKNVWDSSKDALLLSIDGKKIVAANPSFAFLVKKSTEDLEGENFQEILEDTKFFMNFQKTLDQLDTIGLTFLQEVKWSNQSLEMEVYTKVINSDIQEGRLILTVFRDVTIERQIEKKLTEAKEKAEEANRFKTSLLSNVSHEIRTPLNVILGGTEHIMMKYSKDPKLLSELDLILQSGERLLTTISSILDMAKIEANKMQVSYSFFDVKAFISAIMKPYFSHAERKGLQLKLEFLKDRIEGSSDKRFLEMIINNLIGNAMKYTESGVVKMTVDHVGDLLKIEILDNGVGMEEDFLQKVFDPFEQESSGNQRKFEGTGLGMTITKNLLELLKGGIHLESAKNKGTRVIVEIPLSES
ncbi:sensor histidine kinase [Algoriphagus algorifonticola]|uniref:sensor histidine kinase n=1 Tax=Algoriphagus algorifonticola TaxID=2593007 RepID=UPI0011A6647D|nr:ATP-binding protein [Algoriphagus algorifonticola]